jgi:hypothetical protein
VRLPAGSAGGVVDRVQAVVFVMPIMSTRVAHWTGVFGRLPSCTVTVRLFPVALDLDLDLVAGALGQHGQRQIEGLRIVLPAIAVITSPPRMPALSAGEPFVTVPTTGARGVGLLGAREPEPGAVDLPLLISFGTTP